MAEFVRGLVRTAVLKTNPYPPFRFLNRLPYRFALRAVRDAARKLPEIRSLCVRSGFTTSEWIPALSDIDLVALLQPGLGAEREFEIVTLLRSRYRSLQRRYPMLGELVVLAQDDLEAWSTRQADAPGGPKLRVLCGEPVELRQQVSSAWQERALKTALYIYLDSLLSCLSQPPGYLRDQDVARRVRKIRRLLAPLAEAAGEALPPAEDREPAGALKLLETAVAFVESIAPSDPADSSWFPAESNGCRFVEDPPEGFPDLHAVLRFGDRMLLVVSDGLPRQRLIEIASAAPRFGPRTLLASRRMFRYLVGRYNPHDYSDLFRKREVIWGEDPLPGVEPPGTDALFTYGGGRSAGVIRFARGEEICGTELALPAFETEVERAMELRLMLERGWVHPDRAEIARRWRVEFPQLAEALERIQQQAGAGMDVRREAFHLFRSLQRDLCPLLIARDERTFLSLSSDPRV